MPKALDDLQQAIKKQLKKDNPNLSDKELDRRSWAIANAQWKKMQSKSKESLDEHYDEEGRYIVAENAKILINSDILSIEE